MSDQVLSDEQVIRFDHAILHASSTSAAGQIRHEIERAVVAALAARSGVDVEALASSAAGAYLWPEHGERISPTPIADALHLALATAEARHAESRHVAAESTQRYVESILREHEEREAALRLLWSWVENWSPSFTDDPEWPETAAAVRAALGLA